MKTLLLMSAALGCGSAGAWLISCWGARLCLLDIPSERSSHAVVTPKGGGVGVLLAFVMAALWSRLPMLIWGPVVVLALVSLANDRRSIPSGMRLLVQFACAAGVLAGLFPNFPISVSGWLLGGLCLFYLVGTANIYNFMDGINGMAGLTAVVGFGLLAAWGWTYQQDDAWIRLCLAIMAAIAGFLPFNYPRALVFLGDVGSILLGFLFAGIVVQFNTRLTDFIVLNGFLLPFYSDELASVLIRLKRRRSLLKPHRLHFYQYLVNEKSWSHGLVAGGYAVAQLLSGLLIWWGMEVSPWLGGSCFAVSAGLMVGIALIIPLKRHLRC